VDGQVAVHELADFDLAETRGAVAVGVRAGADEGQVELVFELPPVRERVNARAGRRRAADVDAEGRPAIVVERDEVRHGGPVVGAQRDAVHLAKSGFDGAAFHGGPGVVGVVVVGEMHEAEGGGGAGREAVAAGSLAVVPRPVLLKERRRIGVQTRVVRGHRALDDVPVGDAVALRGRQGRPGDGRPARDARHHEADFVLARHDRLAVERPVAGRRRVAVKRFAHGVTVDPAGEVGDFLVESYDRTIAVGWARTGREAEPEAPVAVHERSEVKELAGLDVALPEGDREAPVGVGDCHVDGLEEIHAKRGGGVPEVGADAAHADPVETSVVGGVVLEGEAVRGAERGRIGRAHRVAGGGVGVARRRAARLQDDGETFAGTFGGMLSGERGLVGEGKLPDIREEEDGVGHKGASALAAAVVGEDERPFGIDVGGAGRVTAVARRAVERPGTGRPVLERLLASGSGKEGSGDLEGRAVLERHARPAGGDASVGDEAHAVRDGHAAGESLGRDGQARGRDDCARAGVADLRAEAGFLREDRSLADVDRAFEGGTDAGVDARGGDDLAVADDRVGGGGLVGRRPGLDRIAHFDEAGEGGDVVEHEGRAREGDREAGVGGAGHGARNLVRARRGEADGLSGADVERRARGEVEPAETDAVPQEIGGDDLAGEGLLGTEPDFD